MGIALANAGLGFPLASVVGTPLPPGMLCTLNTATSLTNAPLSDPKTGPNTLVAVTCAWLMSRRM